LAARFAILSDVHANLPALEATLVDCRAQAVDAIICLGDLVRYGPDDCACVDLAREFAVCLQGDWEGQLLAADLSADQPDPLRGWRHTTLRRLRAGTTDEVVRRWSFLTALSPCCTQPGMQFVHGSPRDPQAEYVFPEDIYNYRKMQALFSMVEHVCFQGHTHVPGVFTIDGGYKFQTPEDLAGDFTLTSAKAMINVGSVGRPRDGDSRSCYVILEGNHVQFRRVDSEWLETASHFS
jgi:predicted phosphodiesterase